MRRSRLSSAIPPLLESIHPVFATFLPNVNHQSLASFARTSFFANHLAAPVLAALNQKALRILFDFIRKGDIGEVKKMLNANPHLALVKWKAYNEEDRIITNIGGQRIDVVEKTGYQFSLGEEDGEIAALFEEAILKAADEDEVKKQKREQFPDDWEEKEAEKWKPIFDVLYTLKEVIGQALPTDIISSGIPDHTLTVKANSDVAKDLHRLQELLDARLEEPVTTGRHYNPKPLLRGIYLPYQTHFESYFGNNLVDPRAMLFWRLSGYLQKIMPANYVQAYCGLGIGKNVEQIISGEPQGREFTFNIRNMASHRWVPTSFYPLAGHRLGEDFAIATGGLAFRSHMPWTADVQKLCELKIATAKNLSEQPHQKRRRLA